MRKIFFLLVIICVFATLSTKIWAQSINVGGTLDDYYRRQQLLGKVDSNISFTLRPINQAALKVKDVFDPDSTLRKDSWTKTGTLSFGNGKGLIQILPLSWQQQFNSDHPYGWNDGPMIPAKGYQTLLSGGIFIKYGPLSIQLRPEFVYAANSQFNGFASGHTGDDLRQYYIYNSFIDQPERYGNGSYSKAFWGQSNILLTFNPIAFGLSNENIWWGPGVRNALILSNNAPGFKHATIHTTRPIRTFLGSFEGQIIAGRLDASGYTPLLDVTSLPDGTNLNVPKKDDWRYYTGFNLNYHLRWVPGLTLGLTRTFNAYSKDVSGFSGYFPFFVPYQKQTIINGDPFPRDQYTSLYARWLFKKAQAEVYFEYGLNDNSYNLRDFLGSPDHSRAYIFGIRKMVPFNGKADQNILLSAEITQLSQSPDRLVRDASGWYVHNGVNDGQTNLGQILGAGTGSGGNLQSIDLSWVSGLKRLGINFERYEHNVDFYRTAFPDINGNSRKWVDLALSLQGEWNYKNLILNAKLQGIKSYNYQWILKNYDPSKYYTPNNDVFNFHGELGVTYRF